ncbi:glycoside hydrolase family 16 protein [Arthrobacter sp. AD-310]
MIAAIAGLGIIVFDQYSKGTVGTHWSDGGIPSDTASIPLGDLPGWRQTGVQDFTQNAAAGKVDEVYGPDMRGYDGFPDSSGRGIYTPDAVLSVRNGKLDYFLHTDGVPRVASTVPFGYNGQKYGRYSIRFRYDSLPGYKIAFMLWPVSDDWNDGEIDWPEGSLDGQLYGASAIKGSFEDGAMKFDPSYRKYSSSGPGKWHVATTEWTPGKVRWFLDGKLVDETRKSSGVPTDPMRWTLQAETSLQASTRFPARDVAGHIEIDWVVQYAYVEF